MNTTNIKIKHILSNLIFNSLRLLTENNTNTLVIKNNSNKEIFINYRKSSYNFVLMLELTILDNQNELTIHKTIDKIFEKFKNINTIYLELN